MNGEKIYYTADEVSKIMGISKSVAYVVIRNLNKELNDMGKLTVRGKVNAKFLLSKLEV